ncbi:MAG: DUF2066 domain-containing protein [Rhodomicrobium sp.]
MARDETDTAKSTYGPSPSSRRHARKWPLCWLVAILTIAAGLPSAFAAGPICGTAPNIFKAETIVTGLEEAERVRGLKEDMRILVVKATGRPDIEGSPVVEGFADNPKRYLAQFCYEDRNRHLKINDEQGTRERPHYLRISVDEDRFEQALENAGLTVWRDRPSVSVLLTVTNARETFALAETSETTAGGGLITIGNNQVRLATGKWDGFEVRDTIKTFGERYGLSFLLPSASMTDEKSLAGCVNYRGTLVLGDDGIWKLNATTKHSAETGESGCLVFSEANQSFAYLLRTSLTRLLTWLRTGKGGSGICPI